MKPAPATTASFALAEATAWDAARRRLLWVDILGGTLTATVALTDAPRAEYPLSGHLFTARVQTPGVPVTPWAP